LPRNPR